MAGESREDFCQRGRGRAFHVEGPGKKGKGTKANGGKSDTRKLEADTQKLSGEHV